MVGGLSGVRVDVHDEFGNYVGGSDTDVSGFWSMGVPFAGNYIANTAEWSTGNFVPQVYAGLDCNGCNPQTEGTPIPVSGDVGGIDFDLQPGNTLSGTVFDEFSLLPLENVTVCTARLADFNWVACRPTDASGYYEFNGLLRDDLVVWT